MKVKILWDRRIVVEKVTNVWNKWYLLNWACCQQIQFCRKSPRGLESFLRVKRSGARGKLFFFPYLIVWWKLIILIIYKVCILFLHVLVEVSQLTPLEWHCIKDLGTSFPAQMDLCTIFFGGKCKKWEGVGELSAQHNKLFAICFTRLSLSVICEANM